MYATPCFLTDSVFEPYSGWVTPADMSAGVGELCSQALQQNCPDVPTPVVGIPLCHNTCYVWSHDLVVSQPILTIFSALESTGSLLSKIPKIVEIGSETKSYDSKRMLLSQSGISTPGEPRPILLRGRVHFMVYCLQSFENDRSKL